MSENVNGLSGSLFCHYGEIDDAFVIGGVVEPNETLTASTIGHCKRVVDFRFKPNHRLYLAKIIHGLVDHEPDKTSIYAIDVFCKDLRWKAWHHTPRMATPNVDNLKDIEESCEGQPGPLPPVEIPTSMTIQNEYGAMDEFSIYHWDERAGKIPQF
jgi:hypothetical protein